MKNEKLLKFPKIIKTKSRREHRKQIKPIILPIETLEFCLDFFGKIKSRFDTDLTAPLQNRIAKIIRRLRYFGFLPFTIEEIVYTDIYLDDDGEIYHEEVEIDNDIEQFFEGFDN